MTNPEQRPADETPDDDASWDLAQRLALLAMAVAPFLLGAAVFLLLRQTLR